MKTILLLCGLILIASAVFMFRALRWPSHFGSPFTGAPKAAVADLIDRPKEFMHKTWAIEGIVTKQCTTMGCYFFFQSGKKLLRIELAEIAMNAPRRNGHRARVEGQIVPYGDSYQFVASALEFE